MQKRQYRLTIKCRARCDKGHIGLRKSAYHHAKCTISTMKWALLECEMGSFGKQKTSF